MSERDKPPSRITSSGFARGLRVTRMGMLGGARMAAHSVGNWVLGDKDKSSRQDALWKKQAEMWVREAGALKGSLLKAGQMLALYGEPFLPKEALALLRTLESQAPPVSFDSIREVLIEDLGQEVFDALQVDPAPLGAASLGQVHKAIAPDGRALALKVQYPGVADAVDSDLRAIRRMMSAFRVMLPKEAIDGLFEEVRSVLVRELDYVRERQETDIFRERLSHIEGLRVPETFPAYCSKRVLATSFEEGVSAKDESVQALSQARRNRLAKLYFELYLYELFVMQRIQTDPHLGNFRILIDPSPQERDTLVLLDFGAAREVPDPYMKTYRRMMSGCLYDQRQDILDAGLELGLVYHDDPPAAETAFVDMCRLISEPFSSQDTPGRNHSLFLSDGAYDYAKSDLPMRVAGRGKELGLMRGVRLPPSETFFLDRKLAGTYHFMVAVRAQLNARELLEHYLHNV